MKVIIAILMAATWHPKPQIPTRSVDSTAYCGGGIMSNGSSVYNGAVAMNNVPFGKKWKVLSGSMSGATLTVADRIGWGSEFDVYMSDCAMMHQYGRQQINIQEAK